MSRIAESTKDFFKEEVVKMMKVIGATEIELNRYDKMNWENKWTLKTQGGDLEVKLPIGQDFSFTVFAIFNDVDKANEVLGKNFGHNEFSGKWNFHLTQVAKTKVKNLVKELQDIYVSVLS